MQPRVRLPWAPVVLGAVLAFTLSASGVRSAQRTPGFEPGGAFGLKNQHADMSSPINSRNVSAMKLAWTIPVGEEVSHTPLVRDGRVYFGDWGGFVYAADAQTGRVLWKNKIENVKEDWPWYGFAGTGALAEDKLFQASVEGNAFALDPETGRVLWKTRIAQDPEAGSLCQLMYFNGLVYIGLQSVEEPLTMMKKDFVPDFRGKVLALDADDGELVWQRQLVYPPHNGCAVWSSFALDPELETLYFTTGNNYTGEATELSDALVAVNARTGEIRWARQVTQHDVWTPARPLGPDYDFSGGPQLFEASVKGSPRKLVGAGQKSGIFYVWDRVTGKPVWAASVGYGGVDGGMHGEASIGAGTVVAWSNNGYFHKMPPEKHPISIKAFDAATGTHRWMNHHAAPAALFTAGFLANDVYFMGSLDGKVRAFRAGDGQQIWTSQAHAPVISSLMVKDGSLYFGSSVAHIFGDWAQKKAKNAVVCYRLDRDLARVTPRRGAVLGERAEVHAVDIVARNLEYHPSRFTVRPGQRVVIALINRGDLPHNIEFELPQGEVEFQNPIPVGQVGFLSFTAPTQPGRYTFYCPVANHRERGMTGTLIVEP